MTQNKLTLPITDVKIRIVDNGTGGLVAWVSFIISRAIKLDNIAIRRGSDGCLFLTYPNKTISGGSKHPYFNPISSSAAQAIEEAVMARLTVLAAAAGAAGMKGEQTT
ncbi:MAG: DNA-binding cell septation regulator SpoVG [Candidatus Azotimanducaceae bacterium]|jgi:DNA-binding cell septation regulator SpoVG